MIWVYEQTLKAKLPKPATIQELSQLLWAIDYVEGQSQVMERRRNLQAVPLIRWRIRSCGTGS